MNYPKTKTMGLIYDIFPMDITEIIIGKISPLDIKSKSSEQLFREYCELGYFEMAQIILNNNQIGVGGGLSITCQLGFVDIARIIVQKMDAKMNIGIDEADRNGFQQIVQTITDYSTDYKSHGFYQACVHGQLRVVCMLLENGVRDSKVLLNGIKLAELNQNRKIQEYITKIYQDSDQFIS